MKLTFFIPLFFAVLSIAAPAISHDQAEHDSIIKAPSALASDARSFAADHASSSTIKARDEQASDAHPIIADKDADAILSDASSAPSAEDILINDLSIRCELCKAVCAPIVIGFSKSKEMLKFHCRHAGYSEELHEDFV